MMPQILVRNLDASLHRRLRGQAERNGRSMEEEVRQILRAAVRPQRPRRRKLGSEIAALFAPLAVKDEIKEVRGWLADVPDFGSR